MIRALGPSAGRREPDAAVQAPRVASFLVPRGGRVLELLPDQVACPVLIDPVLQQAPAPQQGLVGDLHRLLTRAEETGSGERADHGARRGRVGRPCIQALRADQAPGVRSALALPPPPPPPPPRKRD